MISNVSNKVSLLAANSNILVVGNVSEQIHNMIDISFSNKEFFDITADSLEIFNNSLFEQFDIVIISFDRYSFELFEKNNITIPKGGIYIIEDDVYIDFKKYINISFATLLSPIDEDTLLYKIYARLAIIETNGFLKTKEKVLNKYKNDSINNEIDTFLDQYSGSIMFINDDLNDSLKRLKDLEISKEVFSDISANLVELSNIFAQNKKLDQLSTLFLEFSQFLNSLDFESIEPSRFEAFDYLTTIVEETTLYIDELFVYRLFKDVSVFEYSIANNIEYFESKLFGNDEKNEDNLEFF
ncbi:MAG: hypothetical protein ACNI25_04920 [Halarcobacter sp.]